MIKKTMQEVFDIAWEGYTEDSKTHADIVWNIISALIEAKVITEETVELDQ